MASIRTVSNQYIKKCKSYPTYLKKKILTICLKNINLSIYFNHIKYQIFTNDKMQDFICHWYIIHCWIIKLLAFVYNLGFKLFLVWNLSFNSMRSINMPLTILFILSTRNISTKNLRWAEEFWKLIEFNYNQYEDT